MQLSHKEPHILRCTVHNRDPRRCYRTGSCASMTSTTAADLPGRHKPVQGKHKAERRNEIMSVLWLAMSDTLTARSGKPGNSGRRPSLDSALDQTRPQRGSNPHCRLPRQPLAHTQGRPPHKQPINPRRHTSTSTGPPVQGRQTETCSGAGCPVPIAAEAVAEAPGTNSSG